MIDAQHAYSPPPGLEYTIPLPPSPAASPTICDSPIHVSETACFPPESATSPAPAMRVPYGGHEPKPGQLPSAGESKHNTNEANEEAHPEAPEIVLTALPVSGPSLALPPEPKVSFEEFAIQYRRRQHAEIQRKDLEQRLLTTKASICLSSRLLRVGATVQKGLVEAFRHGDKPGFVAIHNTLHDIQEACDSALRRNLQRQALLDESPSSLQSQRSRTSGFMHQLSPKARRDLLDIIALARTDSQFLFDRISSLLPSQLSALTSSVACLDTGDSVLPISPTRSRNQSAFSKRNNAHPTLFKDYALAFERTDPLSILLFNVFAVPLDWDPSEAHLRLDVWSSTCAKLLSHGDSKYLSFVDHVLSYWSLCSDWQARPKLELYLMDVLQKGAFLLENVESPVASTFGVEPPDPLRTDAAEEFFDAAVQTLFEVLDDDDAGLPSAALEFGNAILTKLAVPETQDRFLEYFFVQWFSSRFLYNALSLPESQGLLLDFHISKDAREKLLGQIARRAQAQIYRVLHSAPQFSIAHPKVRQHVECMLAKFAFTAPSVPDVAPHSPKASIDLTREAYSSPRSLMLSGMDIITLLNALSPKPTYSPGDSLSSTSPHSSLNTQQSGNTRFSRAPLPSHWSGRIETVLEKSTKVEPAKSVHPQKSAFSRHADVIRFELSELGESEDRPILDHPSLEDWTVLTVTADGKSLSWNPTNGSSSGGIFDNISDDGDGVPTIHPEEDYEALQTAILKLVNETDNVKQSIHGRTSQFQQVRGLSMKHKFSNARSVCENRSDFLGAHYWWAASQQLTHSVSKLSRQPEDDSWILAPMLKSCNRALFQWGTVIKDCENALVTLTPVVEQLREVSGSFMTCVTKLRNKMWYMTDVKNSMRYEDAKHVALALKTMVYPILHREPSNEYRFHNGSRYLAASFLQKPEMQIMNVMKAPSSQGGPNKLSDDQVELTRKWLSHHGIDNFCRGEERIHRFCYEVKSSINKLVGDTMTETPVLWASELFQKERAKFEAPGSRGFTGLSSAHGVRPSSIGSEDALHISPFPSLSSRTSESLRSQEIPPLMQKQSFQSLSEKWKASRTLEVDTTSSLGDSPGRAASSSTTESYSTFWSPTQTQAQSAASASSFQSRPPSMFSDAPVPRRTERVVHGKTVFLDDLRQTLTGLFLSDLGSPVWSCGSETDAWFMNFLNQKRVQVQMNKQAKIQKFLAETETRTLRRAGRSATVRSDLRHRRTQSADPVMSRSPGIDEQPKPALADVVGIPSSQSTFAYGAAFRQLMDVFSRNANPYVKLKALRDLRALVVASLNSNHEVASASTQKTPGDILSAVELEKNKLGRHSFSEHMPDDEPLKTPTSPIPESVELDSHPSYDLSASESQIVRAMKILLREFQPKTLFRDLQFVSAFVPSETLNKTDSGSAFLQFGLAALSLKDEVCSSMVELADGIVSQELNRRHFQNFDIHPRPQDPIEDAARMWIITAKEGNSVAQRELAILYLTHPEILPRVTLPLTLPRDTFKAEMMYRRGRDSKSDPQSMCLALHWMQLSANGGDELARNRLREREEFESLV